MRFLDPGLLIWAALALPVLLLFFVKRRPKRVRVSALQLFPRSSESAPHAPAPRKLRRWLAALLAVTTVLVGALALAHPTRTAARPRTVLILLDRSASMGALDAAGRTRLESAYEHVEARLADLTAGDHAIVMQHDVGAETVLERTADLQLAASALRHVRPACTPPAARHGRSHEEAVRQAAVVAEAHGPADIWHVTDRPLTQEAIRRGVGYHAVSCALSAPRNVGIASVRLQRTSATARRVQVGLHGSPGPVAVTATLDGARLANRTTEIDATRRGSATFDAGAAKGLLRIRVRAQGDVLAADDVLEADLADWDAPRVLWVRDAEHEDPFTRLALEGLVEGGTFEVLALAPPSAHPDLAPYDIVVFDRWLPERWPEDIDVLAIAPQRSLGPLRAAPIGEEGVSVDRLRVVEPRHPLVGGLHPTQLVVQQTVVLGGVRLRPIWEGADGPLLAAGRIGTSQRVVALAFEAQRSARMGTLPAWPLLLENALRWLSGPERRRTFSADEIRLPKADPPRATRGGRPSGPRAFLLWALLLLLVVEAWLFHRHGVR